MAKKKPVKKKAASTKAAVAESPAKRKAAGTAPDKYADRKTRERERQSDMARQGADLGEIPPCKNPKRRAKAERDIRVWAETYAPKRFQMKWAPHHLVEWREIQEVIQHGGRKCIADPRGDGKTTRLEVAVLYAVLTGRHRYAALLTAIGKHAGKRITSIKMLLMTSDTLLEDYPEVIVPLRRMGNTPNRAAGLHINGEPCWPAPDEVWSKRRIVLPTVAGSKCSGAVLEASGLLEALRGLNAACGDGKIIRPSVLLVDDPSTQRSARSALQNQEREEAMSAGLMFLKGPDDTLSAFASVTVIKPDDLASRLVDREIHPEWNGTKNKLMSSFPTRMDLWEQYGDIYRDELADGSRTFPKTSRFYRKHRKLMDAGAAVTWNERKEDCLSAIELAMRLFFKDRSSFFSEMQNEPEADFDESAVEMPTAEQIAHKVSGHARGEVPTAAERLTWFADVHGELLYWMVCAWEPGFTGHVLDYGTWPKQSAAYFDMRHARLTISNSPLITATTLEGRVTQALDLLYAELAARDWTRGDGAKMALDLGLTDANWGELTDQVYAVCQQAQRKHGLRVMPSHGQSFGPDKCPISRRNKKTLKGTAGDEWQIPPPGRGRAIRHVIFDANRRKSFMYRRLATPIGDPGSLTLYHGPPSRHRLLGDHLAAEKGSKVSGQYGELTLFKAIPGRDNHWLDCLSGCCTGESILGGKVQTVARPAKKPAPTKRTRVSYLKL